MERRDAIDDLLDQWSWAPYDLPLVPMAIAKRITLLAHHLDQLAATALAPYDLERGEFDVLVTLLRSGPSREMTPTALGTTLLISSGGLTKRLARLEARKLVARRLDDADRRSLLVALTPAGRKLVESAVAAHTGAIESLVGGLGAAESERLAGLLRELVLSQRAGATRRQAVAPPR